LWVEVPVVVLVAAVPIEARIADAQRRLSRLTRTDALNGLASGEDALAAQWATLNLTRQAAIVETLISFATVAAGQPGVRAFDPARVSVSWRV